MPLKVLLCSPPLFDFYYSFHRSEPLGLLYIKEALSDFEWLQVDIFDARYHATSKAIATPEIFSYLEHIYVQDTSWFSLLNRFKRFGYSFETIVSYIKEHQYDVVCIASLFTAYHYDVERLVQQIKRQTNAIVIVGGWAVFADETIPESGCADVYVRGDGEVALPKILELIYVSGKSRTNLPKVVSSDNDRSSFFITRFPTRDMHYSYFGKKIANVICSKGCVWHCDFCSVHSRYRFAQRNLDSVAQEFDYLYRKGVTVVNFEDDNFLFNRKFASQLLSLAKHYHAKGMQFLCMNGVTANNLVEVLDDALDAGFIEFNCSLVSSHDDMIHKYHRPALKEMIQTIAHRCVSKVRVIVFLIAGLPHSTSEDCIADILYLARLPVIIGFSPLYMLPGVPMFEAMGIPQDSRLCRGSALYSFSDSFTREDIAAMWKLCRLINRLKNPGSYSDEEKNTHIYFYKKMCRGNVAYYRDTKGNWREGFSFTVHLPDSFEYCDIYGTTHSL